MSNAGIFLIGLLITLVVFVALGILAYGIVLEARDLNAEEQERQRLKSPEPEVIRLSPAGSPSAPHRSTEPAAREIVADVPPAAA